METKLTADHADAICEWINATSAEVDETGDVWVDKAGGARWLTEGEKAEFLRWLAAEHGGAE